MVERFHRQLKAAIRCHQNDQWTRILPTVLLGIRAAWREDLQATAAELVYGEPLRLPGEFLTTSNHKNSDQVTFTDELRRHMQQLRPADITRHGTVKTFIFKDLATSKNVFIRRDTVKNSLDMPYDGPYPVVNRHGKTFSVKIHGRDTTVTIDRLKPAYTMSEEETDTEPTPLERPHHLGTETPNQPNPPTAVQHERTPDEPTSRQSNRRVRFTERYQAGFN
ncbi:uncharacterized protein LOC131675398 [Phymastichus coffea]|uniref:uncharacterized protein LOC131675398 n=1 Tax=Phymastichus coffea TaxID=108790 RepID=UPI00273B818F|nr:uncharacterized protein LOC131675398 [Phymastichus coffea]